MPFIKSDVLPKTGNKIIDIWHDQLAHSVNRAYEVWSLKQSDGELEEALESFFQRVRRHFVQEESIIRGAGYEDWKGHVMKHRVIRSDLEVCVGRLKGANSQPGHLIDAFSQIDSLIYDHEFLEDQDFWAIFEREARVADGEPLIHWKSGYVMGVPQLDREHMAMVTMLNTLFEMAFNDRPSEDLTKMIVGLRDHAVEHFKHEEEYGRRHHLPDWGEHGELHDYLIEDLHELVEASQDTSADDIRNTTENYLRYWLIDHIVNADDVIRKHADKSSH